MSTIKIMPSVSLSTKRKLSTTVSELPRSKRQSPTPPEQSPSASVDSIFSKLVIRIETPISIEENIQRAVEASEISTVTVVSSIGADDDDASQVDPGHPSHELQMSSAENVQSNVERSRKRKSVTWSTDTTFNEHNNCKKYLVRYLIQPEEEAPVDLAALSEALSTPRLRATLRSISFVELSTIINAAKFSIPLVSMLWQAKREAHDDIDDLSFAIMGSDTKLPPSARLETLVSTLDKYVEDHVFCRYQGLLINPDDLLARLKKPKRQRGIINPECLAISKAMGPGGESLFGGSSRPVFGSPRFIELQMAVKCARSGECLGSASWLKNTVNTSHSYSAADIANHIVESKGFIRDDRLLVRTQYWVYAHDMTDSQTKGYVQQYLSGEKRTSDIMIQMTWACRHIGSIPYDLDKPTAHSQVNRCTQCAMEWQIDMLRTIPSISGEEDRAVPEKAFCAVVTTWRDIGRCLTPFDPRFQAHFEQYEGQWFKNNFKVEDQKMRKVEEEECATDWAPGEIKRAYEGMDEYGSYELARRERHMLFLFSTLAERKEARCARDANMKIGLKKLEAEVPIKTPADVKRYMLVKALRNHVEVGWNW